LSRHLLRHGEVEARRACDVETAHRWIQAFDRAAVLSGGLWLKTPRGRKSFNVKKMPGYMENRWLAKTTTGVKTQ
jgi:hypothetical protein